MNDIRNFAIIAHIDHGKSTLADRLLEITGTIPQGKMIPQYLDRLGLERERGITIKMQPVRMVYKLTTNDKLQTTENSCQLSVAGRKVSDSEYILNLIDTPGHADFTYEVSRALKAVEGAILLVDAAKGVQAQTVFNFKKAIEQKLAIIPVINKIDLPSARVDRVQDQIIQLFAEHDLLIERSEILGISAKTGQGVEELLQMVIKKIPPPFINVNTNEFQALVFDSFFDSFKGVLAYARVFSGEIKQGDVREFASSRDIFHVKEAGIFIPDFKPELALKAGDIGYIATGIKEPGIVRIGDTICAEGGKGLEGFFQPQPKVFASFYPLEEGEFEGLKASLEKLRLTDPAISFERTESPLLGRGFRCGFLGKLHMEIIAARLDDELGTEIVIGAPSVAYIVDSVTITSPIEFPEYVKDHDIKEPWVNIEIFSPSQYLGKIFDLLQDSDGIFKETIYIDESNVKMTAEMSLDQIVTKDFYDTLKSISQGFASAEYEPLEYRKSKKVRLDILVAGEYIDAFSKIIARHRVYDGASRLVKKLKEVLPKAQFAVSIQARVEGRVIAREDIPALKKAVTEPLYGGDFTRKKKLLVKQREGKKRMRQFGRVQIPKEVFLKII